MRKLVITYGLLLGSLGVFAQGKPVVFKVRAPKAVCSVYMEDSVFWIEKNNNVRVVVRSQNPHIRVTFAQATIVSNDSSNYVVNFENAGSTVISVYEMNGKRPKLIFTKSYKVLEPVMYFCGARVGTRSRAWMMKGEHFKARSTVLNQDVKVLGFDMTFYDNISNKTYHSDSCMLTKEMKDLIFEKYRFGHGKSVYFSNIMARMPDGKEKPLTPFGVFLERDSANTEEIAFNFSLRRITKKTESGFNFEGGPPRRRD